MGKPRVFISYAFVDEQHLDYLFALRLAGDLRQAGADVIVDLAYAGEQAFVHRLNTVLPGCQWMIVVLTPEALQSLRLQMSVSSAMNLLSEKKMRDIFVLSALPTDPSEVPPTWKNLKLIDASSDYPKALARVLLELESGESDIVPEMRSRSYPFFEQSLNKSVSREDNKPSSLPLLLTGLKSEGDRPSSPPPPSEISKGGRSEKDLPQPLTVSYRASPCQSPSRLLVFSATMALLLLLVGGGLFYSLSLRKSSDIANAVVRSKATATIGIPIASNTSAVVHSPTATPLKPSSTATSHPSPTVVINHPGIKPTPILPSQPIFHEFTLPDSASNPRGIVYGADGNVWFSEDSGSAIGRITPSGSVVTYPVTTQNAYFESKSMAVGPDGNVWFCVSTNSEIGRITPSGLITLFKTPTPNSTPVYITKGPDNNMWFTEGGVDKIGRITTSGNISEFAIPTLHAGLAGITAGADGNLWFVEYSGNKVGKMTRSGGVTEYVLPSASSLPLAIVNGPDGNLWFVESGRGNIGKITLSGSITEFSIPTSGSSPQGITSGADGNIWFAESSGDKIGKITLGGTITEYQVPTPGSAPNSITAARDGSLWFTERISGIIGQFVP